MTNELLATIELQKEEIVDVLICIDQLRYVLNYDEDNLMAQYKFKVKRQQERIKNG